MSWFFKLAGATGPAIETDAGFKARASRSVPPKYSGGPP